MHVFDPPDVGRVVDVHAELQRTAKDVAHVVQLLGMRAEVDPLVRVDERHVDDTAMRPLALNRPGIGFTLSGSWSG